MYLVKLSKWKWSCSLLYMICTWPNRTSFELFLSRHNLLIMCHFGFILVSLWFLKSSLLMTILGELPVSEGIKKVYGRVGYASQQAWIFNATVKENILFGQDFDEDRYQQVIECCALKKVVTNCFRNGTNQFWLSLWVESECKP